MLNIGNKPLRKRYLGTTNVLEVFKGITRLWPYIVSTTYTDWNIAITSSKYTVGASGDVLTITHSARRNVTKTWVNYEGNTSNLYKETQEEISYNDNITTNIGIITPNTLGDAVLQIPVNTGAERNIVITATKDGISKSITIKQEAVVINYKYYAVTTDAYQVTAEGQTKTVPTVNDDGPTDSYHYGTVVFSIAEGPSSINASFVKKDYALNTGNGICQIIPLPAGMKGLDAMTLRVLTIGSLVRSSKVMTVPEDVVLTAYDTEQEAKDNAITALCTINNLEYVPEPDKTTLNTKNNATFELVSEETTDEAYYGIYDIDLPYITTSEAVSLKCNTSHGTTTKIIQRVVYQNTEEYNRFGIVDLYGYTTERAALAPTIALFTAAPSGITIDDCATANSSSIEHSYVNKSTFSVNDASGNEVSVSLEDAGMVLYLYEWLYDTSTWIKIGEFVLEQNAVQGFIFKHGIANSLERKLYHKAE